MSKCFGVQLFSDLYGKAKKYICVSGFSLEKNTTRAVRVSDHSPAIALSEEKDKLV